MKKTKADIEKDIIITVVNYYDDCFDNLLKKAIPEDAERRDRVKKFSLDLAETAGRDIILMDAIEQVIKIVKNCDLDAPFEAYAEQAATIVEASAAFAVRLAIAGEQFIVKMKEDK